MNVTYITASPRCSSLVELPAEQRSLKKKRKKKKIQNHPNLKPAQTCGGARFCSSAGAGEVWLTDGLFLFDKKKIKIDVCVEHARPDQSIKEELRLAEADFSGFSEESERLNGSSCCIWRRETV